MLSDYILLSRAVNLGSSPFLLAAAELLFDTIDKLSEFEYDKAKEKRKNNIYK